MPPWDVFFSLPICCGDAQRVALTSFLDLSNAPAALAVEEHLVSNQKILIGHKQHLGRLAR
jgi:hypothetical protein